MQRAKVSLTRSAAHTDSGGSGVDSAGTGAAVTFSRPTSSVLAEKNDVRCTVWISGTIDDLLRRYAREHGLKSTSDSARAVLEIALLGPAHVMSVHRQRIEALARNLHGIDTEPGGGE